MCPVRGTAGIPLYLAMSHWSLLCFIAVGNRRRRYSRRGRLKMCRLRRSLFIAHRLKGHPVRSSIW